MIIKCVWLERSPVVTSVKKGVWQQGKDVKTATSVVSPSSLGRRTFFGVSSPPPLPRPQEDGRRCFRRAERTYVTQTRDQLNHTMSSQGDYWGTLGQSHVSKSSVSIEPRVKLDNSSLKAGPPLDPKGWRINQQRMTSLPVPCCCHGRDWDNNRQHQTSTKGFSSCL